MKIAQFFRLSAVFLLLIGCTSKKETSLEPFDDLAKYQEYISEITHGIISTKSDVRVVLQKPIPSWENGGGLDNDLLLVSPKVKGKVVSLNNRTIAFVPEKGFEQDTEYTFTLAVKEIIDEVPKELRNMVFGIKTQKQQFNLYTEPLQSYSKELQYINGQVRSADIMPLSVLNELVSVTHEGKAVKVIFDETIKEGTQFYFKIDSIQRYIEDTSLEISWDGSKRAIESSGKQAIQIPGKNNFTVMEAIVHIGEGQMVSINFSDPIKKGQNLKGLVVLGGATDPKFSIDGNTLKVYPDQEIKGASKIEVFEGIESADGYKLKSKYEERVAFEQIKPEVRFLTNGTILPASNNLKINFETVNLNAVDVTVLKIYENNILQFLQGNEMDGNYNLRSVARPVAKKKIELQTQLSNTNGKWTAHALDLKTLIQPDPGAIYRVELDFKPSYSSYVCEATNFGTAMETEEDYDGDVVDSSWDGVETYYQDYYYDYNWNERDNPCHTSYYYNKKIGLNVLASDLGVTIKKGINNSYFVAVNDILNTAPVAGAKVTFYNFQQQPIGNVITDGEGMSVFDAEKTAFFAIVENNGQKTYVKLNDGNALSVSKFNVSGERLQKGIKGFIFGERGVWRPGDRIYLSFLLNDNANKLPENHPVKLELLDPYNKVVLREVQTSGLNNFYHFNIKTDENAPTGNWLAKVTVGGASFTKTIKIETIKPNRLKIKSDFGSEVLSSANPITGQLEVKWLHGAIAKNLKADVTAKFNTQKTSFESFPGYVFDDPTRVFAPEEQRIFDGRLNAEGKAIFSMDARLTNRAPGMLNAVFMTKVYENGGDFSTDVFVKPYSPYQTYVGLNTPKGDKARGMLLTDTKHLFEVVSVDEKGNPKAVANLKVTIHKVNWKWWWDTSEDNLSNFSSSTYREKVFDKTIGTDSKGKATFTFELKYPDWGRYLVRVEDPNGGHSAGKTLYIDWPGWAGRSIKNDPSAATMLVFSTDKEKYNVGDTATVTFPSSEGGRALVTVENGNEVLESLWVGTTKGETRFQLPIKDLYAPNVFIHISLLQPHASLLNDAPIRLYGVIPISVEDRATKLEPVLAMPEVLRPEESVTLKVSEANKKAMTYSVAIVDEGLLDLTRFKTPDPWNTFYAHEALGVKTWDIYDDVIGAYGGRIDQVFAIGGDGELAGAKNKKANRFEPMVVYLGPFELQPGQTRSHTIQIPKYVGSVRTMVIAGESTSAAYGSTEMTTPVRIPLMVLGSLPRKMTSGEQVTLPITVFAMEKKVKDVTVKIKKNQAFTVDGAASQTISFSGPDEQMVYFNLNVSDFTGIGEVVVEASGNGEKASFKIPMDVVNPNPISSTVQDLVLGPQEKRTINIPSFGISGSNTIQVELSTLPPMNFNGRMEYLIRYPHGCVEQVTSAAFPQLYLSEIFDLDSHRKGQVQKHLEDAIQRLGSYQLPNGGFSYWPGQHGVNDWGTSYAGHFLLEAEKKGFVLPIGFKSSWINYQQQVAKQWRSGTGSPELAQAYRLYTLALSGNADVASMNRLRETKGLSNASKYRLAATYALIGQKNVAEKLLSNATLDFADDTSDYDTFGSESRNRAMALETYVLLNNKVKARELADTIALRLGEKEWMSTQSTAYCLLAMAKFSALVGGKGIEAKIDLNGALTGVKTAKTLASHEFKIKEGDNALTLTNVDRNTLYVTIVNRGKLPVGEEKEVVRNLKVISNFKGRDGSRIDVSRMGQGTDFVAEVTLINSTPNKIDNVALTRIFPSGWEIVNTRFTDFGPFAENEVDHTDIRDDRTNFYFDLKKYETKTFRVLLNASYLGTYYLPGIQAEAMYDNDYAVRTKGKWIEVVQ
ncbi:alpha-2-macroglobulin family protein [Maribacter polysaccharolyticus]|uniref:alpha-2-macroglobulin family protein n=1 Tax=Maribacter polysaccharolyticus TaxID=3020831 RepID=UPI00237FADD8|nr:MG2 domain-containing protein [Maribacter polysaccharolyticus]MDE3743143.1 MG2 domain-containing protein [Maribacter polysaccharolyticus]